MAGIRQLAGIRRLVATEAVENDNDADTGTNMGRVKGECFYNYFGRRVTLQRIPTSVN
jgi:hypothetical protein